MSSIFDSYNSLMGSASSGLQQTNSAAKSATQTDPMLKNPNYLVTIHQDHNTSGKNAPVFVYGSVPDSFQFASGSQWSAPFGGGLAAMAGENVGNLLAMSGNRLVGQVMTMQVWQGSTDTLEFTLGFELRAWSDVDADVGFPFRELLKMSLPSINGTGFLQSPGPVIDKAAVTELAKGYTDAFIKIAEAGTSAFTKTGSNTASGGTTLSGVTSFIGGLSDKIVSGVSAAGATLGQSGVLSKLRVEAAMKNKIGITIGNWFKLDNIVITNVQSDIKSQLVEAKSGLPMSASVTISFRPVFAITAEDVASMFGKSGASASSDNTSILANGINSTIGKVQGYATDAAASVSKVVSGFGG